MAASLRRLAVLGVTYTSHASGAKALSQGDVKDRTRLARSYLSRVENGHTMPSLPVLQRWAYALEVELYQLFFAGHGQPEPPELRAPLGARERTLLGLYDHMAAEEKSLLMSLTIEKGLRHIVFKCTSANSMNSPSINSHKF